MRTLFELWDKAHEAYLQARANSNEFDRRRLLTEADRYLKRAEELRRDHITEFDESKGQAR